MPEVDSNGPRSSKEPSPTQIRPWSAPSIAKVGSVSIDHTRRKLIPEMIAAGVIARHGRQWFGRESDIVSWFLGRWSKGTP